MCANYAYMTDTCIFGCVLNYAYMTGIFGYLTFGDDITTDVLTSYEADWMIILAHAITAIKAVTSYPILLFCVR